MRRYGVTLRESILTGAPGETRECLLVAGSLHKAKNKANVWARLLISGMRDPRLYLYDHDHPARLRLSVAHRPYPGRCWRWTDHY